LTIDEKEWLDFSKNIRFPAAKNELNPKTYISDL
jgi:hypothetical protein